MFGMREIRKLQPSFQVKLSRKHRLLCHTMASKTIVYDTNSWEKTFELSKKNPGYIKFSRNNGYFYIKNTTGTIYMYNTEEFDLIKTVKSNKAYKMIEGDFGLTKDEFIILDTVQTKNGKQLALINAKDNKYQILTSFEDLNTILYYHHYVLDENSHYFTISQVDKDSDMRVNKLLKVKEETNGSVITVSTHPELSYWNSLIYNSIHQVYIVIKERNLVIVDSNFKMILNKKSIVENEQQIVGYFLHVHQSANGKFIIVTYSEQIFIIRFQGLQVIVTERVPYPCFAEFSEDDDYLLIGTWENGYVLENNLE
ncbi:hypothetical protein GJU40_14910 [Bacillus lacus]|uniref:Uncharacterized protein n=1 Tax=Metabacillus lacus TaxID=1983721 RepID=A0A7X2J192_9BACI|nr:hypothetical protein [Metabacillus lacus]MRX73434.1 hypothetical protein [Metabacillus lacus]